MSQLAMVIDLNKCIGCQTCTVACKRLWTDTPGKKHMWWNIVNTQPGEGTPRGWQQMQGGFRDGRLVYGPVLLPDEFGAAWEFNFDEALFGGDAGSTHLKPKGPRPRWGPNWDEDQGGGTFPNSYYFYLPRLCNHCTNPACLKACPVEAISKRQDGIVLINEDLCKGVRLCQAACPYKRIYFREEKRVSGKCIGCFPRIERGVAPACVRQCPGRARHYGELDDESGHLHQLVETWGVALPLLPDRETQPNVYYVPPMLPSPLNPNGTIDTETPRVPREFLHSLFGPAVDQALATLLEERKKKLDGGESELMDLLISRRWHDMMRPFHHSPVDDG